MLSIIVVIIAIVNLGVNLSVAMQLWDDGLNSLIRWMVYIIMLISPGIWIHVMYLAMVI